MIEVFSQTKPRVSNDILLLQDFGLSLPYQTISCKQGYPLKHYLSFTHFLWLIQRKAPRMNNILYLEVVLEKLDVVESPSIEVDEVRCFDNPDDDAILPTWAVIELL